MENMDFRNDTLSVLNLPRMEEVDLNKLEKDYLKIMYFNFFLNSIITLSLLSIPVILLLEDNVWILIVYTFILLVHILNFFFVKKRFAHKKYAIREHDIIYQSGWLQLTTAIVPFNKIQNVSIQESWLARKYNLAKLNLYTTGDTLSIEGLSKDTATTIQALILNKIAQNDPNYDSLLINNSSNDEINISNNFHEDAE